MKHKLVASLICLVCLCASGQHPLTNAYIGTNAPATIYNPKFSGYLGDGAATFAIKMNTNVHFLWLLIQESTNNLSMAHIKDATGVTVTALTNLNVTGQILGTGNYGSAPTFASIASPTSGLNIGATTVALYNGGTLIAYAAGTGFAVDGGNTFSVGTGLSTLGGGLFLLNKTAPPVGGATGGYLWPSNNVLYWVTSLKTNVVSDGQ